MDEPTHAPHPGLNKALCEALIRGDVAEVKMLLDQYDADPNAFIDRYKGDNYYIQVNDHALSLPTTPFAIAMLQGNDELIRLLLERGASPNCEYYFSWSAHFSVKITPLGQAIKAGDLDLVKLLLEKGASTSGVWRPIGWPSDDTDSQKIDALTLAGREGMREIGDLLEECEKARAEWERTRPKTPQEINDSLCEAVRFGSLAAAEEAIRQGADASYVYDGSDYEERDYREMPVLYMACNTRNAEMVKLLLSHGADPNAYFFHSSSISEYSELKPCLAAAVASASVEIVRLLLEAGAYPTVETGYKERDWMRDSVMSNAERRGESDPAFLEIANLLKEYASGKSRAETGWELGPKENPSSEDVDKQ